MLCRSLTALLPSLFILLLNAAPLQADPSGGGDEVPTPFGFKPGTLKPAVLAQLGEPRYVSGTPEVRQYHYEWRDGSFEAILTFFPGDLRLQTVRLTAWGSDLDPALWATDLAQKGADTTALSLFGLDMTQAQRYLQALGEPVEGYDTWSQWIDRNGHQVELFFGGEDSTVYEITVNYIYEWEDETPAAYREVVPPPARGQMDVRALTSYFGLELGMTEAEVTALRGAPNRVDRFFDDPVWQYLPEALNANVALTFSAPPGMWYEDVTEDTVKELGTLAVSLWSFEPSFWAVVKPVIEGAGFTDPLLAAFGKTRAELRTLYGDPDTFGGWHWTYQSPQVEGEAQIYLEFRLDGPEDSALVSGLTIQRW